MKLSLLLTLLLAGSLAPLSAGAIKSPIIFFPGITNSALDARNSGGGFCNTGDTAQRVWVEPLRLFLCGEHELSLRYDPTTNFFEDQPGVTIEVPGFGGTEDVEYTGLAQTTPYLNIFVEYFVDRGYVRGKSIRTVPYDWRLAADELERRGYHKKVQSLVEETYKENGNEKVTLVAHSMGGLVSHHFLTAYSGINQAWKDKYINAWVPLSGAWSGGVQTLTRVIYGQEFDNDFLSYVINGYLVPILRTFPSILWLTPRASVFKNMVLISTPGTNYTAADLEELYKKTGYTNGFQIYNHLITTVTPNFPPPNVPTYCYYGYNVPTPETFIFNEDFDPQVDTIGMTPASIVMGNGDGTVNQASSAVCHQWQTMDPQYSFWVRQYEQVNHSEMVRNERVLGDVALIAGASPPSSTVSRK